MSSRKWFVPAFFVGIVLQMSIIWFGVFGLDEYIAEKFMKEQVISEDKKSKTVSAGF
jgi:hypothetical protein